MVRSIFWIFFWSRKRKEIVNTRVNSVWKKSLEGYFSSHSLPHPLLLYDFNSSDKKKNWKQVWKHIRDLSKERYVPEVTVHDLVLLATFCRTGLGRLVSYRSKKHFLVSSNKFLSSPAEITGGCLVNSFLSIKGKRKKGKLLHLFSNKE